MKPVMSSNEVDCLHKYMNEAMFYFEFGSGGTTCLASSIKSIKKIWTVESNQKWVDELKNHQDLNDRLERNEIHFDVVDIHGNPHFWGYPMNETMKDNWPMYSQSIQRAVKVGFDPDFVLIDGRFRVACALQVAMYCDSERLIICVHDYSNRGHYHEMETFLDRMDEVDTMVCFRIKKGIRSQTLLEMYEKYKYDAR